MAVKQVLPRRYIDKQKLATFWTTHPDFKGYVCGLQVRRLPPISQNAPVEEANRRSLVQGRFIHSRSASRHD
jgi:hypothetical protein